MCKKGNAMFRRLLPLLLGLTLALPMSALGEGYIPQPDESADDMVPLSGEELLERMAELP